MPGPYPRGVWARLARGRPGSWSPRSPVGDPTHGQRVDSAESGGGLLQEVLGGEPHGGVVALPDLVAVGVDEDEAVSGDPGVHAGPEGAVGLGDGAVV